MKKLLLLVIIFTVVCSLAACSSRAGNTVETGASPSTESSAQDIVSDEVENTAESNNTKDDGAQIQTSQTAADEVQVILQVDERQIPAVIYNTTASQSLLNSLPHTMRLSKGSIDFCGDIGIELKYGDSDLQHGVNTGDLTYWIPGGDFVIFLTTMPPAGGDASNVGLGRILNKEDTDFLINYNGSSTEIEITLAK